jgi:hypothetical protein
MNRIIHPETIANEIVADSLILSNKNKANANRSLFFSVFQTQINMSHNSKEHDLKSSNNNFIEYSAMALLKYCNENNLKAVKEMLSNGLNNLSEYDLGKQVTRDTKNELLNIKSLEIDLEYKDEVNIIYYSN